MSQFVVTIGAQSGQLAGIYARHLYMRKTKCSLNDCLFVF